MEMIVIMLKKIQILMANIIMIVGALLIAVGSISLSQQISIMEEYEAETVTVLDLNEDNEAYIRYRYNGDTYREWVHVYDLQYAINDHNEIKVYINSANPSDVIYINGFTPSVFTACGFIIIMTGGLIKACVKNKTRNNTNTKDKTEKIKINQNTNSDRITFTARVITTSIDYSQNDNGRCPIRLVCKYEDPSTNIPYVFTSNAIYTDPTTVMNALVYVSADRHTYENAVVDTTRIIRKKESE